jgi:hypothetical protein
MRGDKGSPCRTPLLHLNCLPETPLSSTDEDPEERMALIQDNHLSEKTFMLHNL